MREFECSSYTDFLIWKENEEEMSNTYYVQCIGKRAFNDSGNEDNGNSYTACSKIFILHPAIYMVQIFLLFLLLGWESRSK